MALTPAVVYAPAEGAYWEGQPYVVGTTVEAQPASDVGASRATWSFSRQVPTGLVEDRATFGLWFSNWTLHGGAGPLTVAQMTALQGDLDTFTQSCLVYMANTWTWKELIWHNYDSSLPRTDDGRGQKAGPPAKVVARTDVGASTSAELPHQVASNMTVRTASRRHWGRAAIPGLTFQAFQTDYGRLANTAIDALATAINTLSAAANAKGQTLGVWSQLHPAFLTAYQLEVDDVPDIIRRRRPKQTGYRKIFS